MKKFLIFLLIVIFGKESFGQIDSLKTISLDIDIMVINQDKIKKELKSFFKENKIVPELLMESKNEFTSSFVLSESSFFIFTKNIETWGAINSRKIESINYTEKLQSINIEINRLKKEKEEYDRLLAQIDVKSDSHVKYWEKLEEIKNSLRKQLKKKEKFEDSNKKFKVKLKVSEENFLSNEPDFSFVNMPGIQYSYFIPVNLEGESFPKSMNGYAIKYLMNRKKTYLELGLFKSNKNDNKTKYDELYKFGLGQDFYSNHLGRGTRKFFNLYSGFNLGIFIITSDEDNLTSWYATPSIGLEIYKNKNFLLDTKTGYFLPFKENRNMRGLLIEASLNIVF